MAFVGVLAAASLLASTGIIQQSATARDTLLVSEPPSAAPAKTQLNPVRDFEDSPVLSFPASHCVAGSSGRHADRLPHSKREQTLHVLSVCLVF